MGLGLGAVALCLPSQLINRCPPRTFFRSAWVFLALSRASVFLVVFVFFGVRPESDILLYYTQAKGAIAGLLPYRDFPSSYAPLFPYAAGLALRVWESPLSIILSIAFELAAFPVWIFICGRSFGDETTRFATMLYLASVVPLVNVGILGQNQVWLMLLLGVALGLLQANRSFLSGLAIGVALVAVKFLALLFGPFLIVAAPARLRWLVGMATLPIVVYGFFWLEKVNVFAPVTVESALSTSGNLPFLVRFIWSATPAKLFDVLTLVALAVTFFAITKRPWRRVPMSIAIIGTAAVLLVLLIFSKKAYSNYLMTAFFPIYVVAAASGLKYRRVTIALFAIFGTVAVLEPSLWFRWLHEKELRTAWLRNRPLPKFWSSLRANSCCYFFIRGAGGTQ